MKYITYEMPFEGRQMILFPANINHDFIARSLGVEHKVLSAGFVYCQDYANNGAPYCTGHSVTLCKHAKEGDNELLTMLLRG